HDFNNLLTVILGYAHSIVELCSSGEDGVGQNQFLQDQDRPDRAWQIEVRRSAERIRSAADRATALTRQSLAFGRRQMLEPRVLHRNSVIAEMDKVVRRLFTDDMEITTRPGASRGSVKAHAAPI